MTIEYNEGGPLTVSELREILSQLPDDMRVFITDDASWIHPDVAVWTTCDIPKWARRDKTDEEVVVIG